MNDTDAELLTKALSSIDEKLARIAAALERAHPMPRAQEKATRPVTTSMTKRR
ncbi:MAG: hypothetical protein IAG13_25310 [Deltaproteobacteria bacterium]|nr:hypothetical protein [Nannocystaceae bacterium]